MRGRVLAPIDGGTRKGRFLAFWRRLWDQAQAESDLLLFVEAQAYAGFMTDEVAVRKAAVSDRWMAAMGEFGIQADPSIATSMLVGTLTAAWRSGLEVDPDDLGERLWAALRSE